MKGNAAQIAAGRSKLSLLADILAEVNLANRPYRQAAVVSESGAASCALGYWCAHKGIHWLDFDLEEVQSEFALTTREAAELFAGSGCGNAKTAGQASAYLRKFLSRQRDPHTFSSALQTWKNQREPAAFAS